MVAVAAFVECEGFPNLGIDAIDRFDNAAPLLLRKLHLDLAVNGSLGHRIGVLGDQRENAYGARDDGL